MNVLITGAQFANKGAQSMLFTTVDYLKRRYQGVDIFYLPRDKYASYADREYGFHVVYNDGDIPHMYERGGISKLKVLLKHCIKKAFGKKSDLKLIRQLHDVLGQTDLMIDVSGYQLSSQWPLRVNDIFLRSIEEAQKYDIPVILMPQSFGPFEYGDKQEMMDRRIYSTLSKCKEIFVREREGYQLLQEKYGLENVQLSPDLVLQAGPINWSNICPEPPVSRFPILEGGGYVGIVPNFQNMEHGNEEAILQIYKDIIGALLSLGKIVVIFRHSEDLGVCKRIHSLFDKGGQRHRVRLIEEDIDLHVYDAFNKQFDFIVCSRYHGIVHALKNFVPCIFLGWANKYRELAESVGQERFCFDITNENVIAKDVVMAVGNLDSNLEQVRETLRSHVLAIQEGRRLELMLELMRDEQL